MESRVLDIIRTVGKGAANALFPDDIEYYAITFELTDSKGNTIDFLTFPVNPDQFTYGDKSLVSIRKTLGGVTSLNTETFVPKEIVMSGTFGKSFKLLGGPPLDSQNNLSNTGIDRDEGLSFNTNVLNTRLKSGYGTIKVLEKILVKSKELDLYNNPHTMYLYLPLIGHNFIVDYKDFNLRQDFASSNTIWKYNIQLTALAPIIRSSNISQRLSDAVSSVGINIVQRGANSILNNIRRSIF